MLQIHVKLFDTIMLHPTNSFHANKSNVQDTRYMYM